MVVFLYILTCLIWGSTWIAIKLGLSSAPPLWAVAIRFSLAALILLAIVRLRRLQLPQTFREFSLHAIPGFFLYGASYALVYFGELYISSSLTAVLFASFPFFITLMSHFLLPDDKSSTLTWLGMVLGFAGVVVISWHTLGISGDLFRGSLLVVLAASSSATGNVFHKKLFSKTNFVVSAACQMSFGSIFLLTGALLSEPFSGLVWSRTLVASIAYLAVFGSVTAFLGYYWLITKMSLISAAMISFVTPVVAGIIGVTFFKEEFTLPLVMGAGMILCAILIVNYSRLPGTGQRSGQKIAH